MAIAKHPQRRAMLRRVYTKTAACPGREHFSKSQATRRGTFSEPLRVSPPHPLYYLLVLLHPSLDVCEIFNLE
jgi:hypothetical protein